MTTDSSQLDPSGWRALLAVGALSQAEAEQAERELGPVGGDEFASVVELLAEGVDAVPPPRGVREALMARAGSPVEPTVSPQVWKNWPPSQDNELFIMRSHEGAWENTGVAGVFVRRLFVDRPRNQMTMLVRMDAGASYPRHVHDGPEECLVLEGDLQVGDTVLHPGDYQRAAPGSKHGIQSTERGCLLMITSSLSDELE